MIVASAGSEDRRRRPEALDGAVDAERQFPQQLRDRRDPLPVRRDISRPTGISTESAAGFDQLDHDPAVLAIWRSRVKPSRSYVESAPLKRKPAGTSPAPSGYPSTVPPPRRAIRSTAPASAAVATPRRRWPLQTKLQ